MTKYCTYPQFPPISIRKSIGVIPYSIAWMLFQDKSNFLSIFFTNFLSERKKWPGRKGGKKK
ncbi:MAG: hypothetical protein Greene101415_1053 [Parcubacteria group bacterium Greene1014_15]|nr:MAG: hypothetical protein Greene101415_1053 [Parcubacteria group bacterium Greene1014_15]